jgi:signal transduction histidine kinase
VAVSLKLQGPAVTDTRETHWRWPGTGASTHWLRDLPITAKLASIVVTMVAIITGLVAVTAVCLHVASGIRAYVGGEGLWSKGQKDAVYYLTRYVGSAHERDYRKFRDALALPLGDHAARIEMERASYSYPMVEAGFIAGGNAAADVPSMVFVFRHFGEQRYLREAIAIWRQADVGLLQLEALGGELHDLVQRGQLDPERAAAVLGRIEDLNAELTPLEQGFSATLGAGARWGQDMMLMATLGAASLLLLAGLLFAGWISSELRVGIMALREGALRISRGDLSREIPVRSRDELGDLATVFNEMIARRRATEKALRDHQDELATHAEELARSNAELEQFAYVASHDLQEPLRTVSSYAQLLARRYGAAGGPEGAEYVAFITEAVQRMRALIQGLLDFSRISRQPPEHHTLDLDVIVDAALANLGGAIQETGAQIVRGRMPVLLGDRQQLIQVFQNLIGNALKFRRDGEAPRVELSATRKDGLWTLSVRDHGIGIEPQYAERVFVLFQRLHTRDRYPGSGIGLALCRRIVEAHGGRIWVEPADGPGTDLRITLPAV